MADELAPKLAIITINLNNGKVVDVEGKNGAVKSEPTPQEIENAYNSGAEFRHVGAAMFTHSSPGCLYWWQGRWIKVC
jgi:hypothetical protein